MQYRFTLHLFFFTKYIVILKILMDNRKKLLMSLEEVIRKVKGRTNRMI